MPYRTYSKELILSDVPTEEVLNEAYAKHKTEGPKDYIITVLLHHFAKRQLRSGFINRPGTYKLSITIKLPVMFWHSAHYKIVRL